MSGNLVDHEIDDDSIDWIVIFDTGVGGGTGAGEGGGVGGVGGVGGDGGGVGGVGGVGEGVGAADG